MLDNRSSYNINYSVTNAAGAKANVDTHCSLDYLLVSCCYTINQFGSVFKIL